MGKKKTPVFRQGKKTASNEYDREGDKFDAIRTWDDIEHDSEDEFHEEREKVLLNGQQESDNEESDREVYGLDGLESESEEELSDDEIVEKRKDEDEDRLEAWGTSKDAYYDGDEVEDLEEMREEEEEALRIQKEHLENMEEADFMDDGLSGWGTGQNQDLEADKKLVEDVNKELEDISFDKLKIEKRRKNLPVAEKLKIVQNESPELLDLLDEFKEKTESVNQLKPVVEKLIGHPKREEREAQFVIFKYETLMNYLTNISFYFALKATETTDVREHPIIQALVQLRQTIEKLAILEDESLNVQTFLNKLDEPEQVSILATKEKKTKPKAKKNTKKIPEETLESVSEQEDMSEESENEQDILNEIRDIEEEFKSLKKLASKKRKRGTMTTDDFGELDALDELDMEDKIAKKKSLRDYIAKIDAKQAKNVNKYQGDVDIPYRDRVKQERKGVAQPQDASADLDDADWDEEDVKAASEANALDSDDEYYSTIANNKKAQKRAKKDAYEAERAPVESRDVDVDEGEKRLATYKILKNKGLTPRRKKENRNARVKHRNKYTQKMKRLSSTRAVVKPQSSGYAGEMSGVKTNVIKSVKLSS
ncbi:MAG: Sas10 C-terminal domain-containing protein [Benjaminiella poitrasii]|nr:MAG: Sas10 C-terminal domain-containing protein [Benjaminiella poitrasii]